MTIRKHREDDEERLKNVLNLLTELAQLYSQYDNTTWASAYMARIALLFRAKYTFEEFRDAQLEICEHYKHLWDIE